MLSRKRDRDTRVFIATCAIPRLFCLNMLTGCALEPDPVPQEILGIWRTDAPRHRDRTFEIRDDAVIFGTGKFSAPRLHVLVRVEHRDDVGDWQASMLFYREYDGSIAELELQYQTQPKLRLRFLHHAEFWYRSDNQGSGDA